MTNDKRVDEAEVVGVKQEAKSESNKAQDFARAYQNLCQEHGFQLVAQPTWASTNHGSFELVISFSVGQVPQQN